MVFTYESKPSAVFSEVKSGIIPIRLLLTFSWSQKALAGLGTLSSELTVCYRSRFLNNVTPREQPFWQKPWFHIFFQQRPAVKTQRLLWPPLSSERKVPDIPFGRPLPLIPIYGILVCRTHESQWNITGFSFPSNLDLVPFGSWHMVRVNWYKPELWCPVSIAS